MTLWEDNYEIATSDMLDALIDNYYAADYQKMDLLMKSIAVFNKKDIEINKLVANVLSNREIIKCDLNEYENKLVQMVDLSTVLSEKLKSENQQELQSFINYLIEKNKEILPEIIEILQLLKK